MTGRAPRRRRRGWRLQLTLLVIATAWLFPLAWAGYAALRPYAETAARGYFSSGALTLDNFVTVWNEAELPRYLVNTLLIVIPGVAVVLVTALFIAFALSRLGPRVSFALLAVFTAANLLPPQALVIPLYRLYVALPVPRPLSDNGVLYDQWVGITIIHVAFQLGFCVFVLSNYLRTLPREVTEAALLDGASMGRIVRDIVAPLCRPALAALAALEFTWMYNDFLWALVLVPTGAKRPITSALANLRGEFFTDVNLLAAGALIAALPTVLVFLVARRHLVRGLAAGAVQG